MNISAIFSPFEGYSPQISFKEFVEVFDKHFDIKDYAKTSKKNILNTHYVVLDINVAGLSSEDLCKEIKKACYNIVIATDNPLCVSTITPNDILISNISIEKDAGWFDSDNGESERSEISFEYVIPNVEMKDTDNVTYKSLFQAVRNYLKTKDNKNKVKRENIQPFLNMSDEDFYTLFKSSLMDPEILKEIKKIRNSKKESTTSP